VLREHGEQLVERQAGGLRHLLELLAAERARNWSGEIAWFAPFESQEDT
jgi:hypothetical protein